MQPTDKSVRTEVMKITPDVAKQWIAATGDANFRRTDHKRVSAIESDIRSGAWQFNGESIKLNGSVVLDGMHRLTACVQAGIPIKSVVVFGLDEKANETIDRIRPRTLSQWMSYKGVKSAKNAACVTRHWNAYRAGEWKNEALVHVSDVALLRFYEQNEQAITSAVNLVGSGCTELRVSRFVPISVLGPLVCQGTATNFDIPANSRTAQQFVSVLRTGQSTSEYDPVAMLRNRMIANMTATSRLQRRTLRALVIHAWNLYVDGETVKTLKYILSGPGARPFPDIQQASV